MLLKEKLQAGKSGQFRSSGWSLWPRVHSGDCCIYEPIVDIDKIKPGDIVFCEVQPGNRFYAHLVLTIDWENKSPAASASAAGARSIPPRRRFWIGNQSGRSNGYCYDPHIYGRLVEVIA